MSRDLLQVYVPLLLQTIVWPIGWVITRFFLKIKINGYEHIKHLDSPVIFAVNHTSELDPIVVTAVLPPLSPLLPMFYTSLDGKYYRRFGLRAKIFYGGIFFKAWGAYPVERGVCDYKKSLRYHIDILRNKKGSVCFFPEGKITMDGNLQEFKGGIAYLAHNTNAFVVPVLISGIYKINPRDFFKRKRNVAITFATPISWETFFDKDDYSPKEYKILAKEIKERFAHL